MYIRKVRGRGYEGNAAQVVPLFRYADRFCVELSQEAFAFGHACSWDAKSNAKRD